MKMFSLRTIIDDILLLVRNNNISESEDLSRDQIAAWVMQYKAFLKRKEDDKDEADGDDDPDDTIASTIGPLELIEDPNPDDDDKYLSEDKSCCCHYMHRKRTKNKIQTLEDSADDIISVSDIDGCVIQYMHHMRRHYHSFRRYTYAEVTCWFDNGYIYLEGSDIDNLKYIYVTGNMDPTENAEDEDDVKIPGWMIPDIKKAIMTNELAFMLNRPSDDSNNSTLASVKPHGPQDKEE